MLSFLGSTELDRLVARRYSDRAEAGKCFNDIALVVLSYCPRTPTSNASELTASLYGEVCKSPFELSLKLLRAGQTAEEL
jgi:hypothetical protein